MPIIIRSLTILGAVALGTAGLAACSSSAKATSSTTSTAAASGSAAAAGDRAGGNSALRDFLATDAAKTCLSAAGISVPSFAARPSGAFPSGARPSGGFPSGERPSGAFPSGARRSGGFGGGAGNEQFTKIEAALKACGLTVPTRSPASRPAGAAPTSAPASS
ncbi:hypothetical protein SAMN05892883_3287 [Jatrophihabitans sp. GAS493]|uniref:hypothetical protein n=1 Tax=Jatrophihabitans sp. GAS493 TaxID=1907575 RepID=UPI000BB9A684|nr:hypothetical protein [Jatrophihabitans sp. GAS493]SOD74111.1 hypothetical protein SAMN05892883_3287 [Jatrophihabitans sp. GAS493]